MPLPPGLATCWPVRPFLPCPGGSDCVQQNCAAATRRCVGSSGGFAAIPLTLDLMLAGPGHAVPAGS